MTGATPNHDFIAGFQRGNYRAISNLYSLHYSDLYKFALQLTEDEQESFDIVVDTFIKLLQRRAQFDNMANIKAFLYLTVRNVSLDFLKYSKQPGKVGVNGKKFEGIDPGANTDMDKVQPQMISEIQNIVDAMPANYQQVFKAMYVKGGAITTIAEQLGFTPREVIQYKTKALHLLQERLIKENLLSIPVLVYYLAIVCPDQKHVGA